MQRGFILISSNSISKRFKVSSADILEDQCRPSVLASFFIQFIGQSIYHRSLYSFQIVYIWNWLLATTIQKWFFYFVWNESDGPIISNLETTIRTVDKWTLRPHFVTVTSYTSIQIRKKKTFAKIQEVPTNPVRKTKMQFQTFIYVQTTLAWHCPPRRGNTLWKHKQVSKQLT